MFGSVFWVLKKTTNGIYYLAYGNGEQLIEISKDEYEKLMLLKDKNTLLEEQIKLLKDK